MPFTVNVGPSQAGNFLASGLSNFGQGIAEGIQKMREEQQNESADRMLFDYAVKNNLMSPDQQTEFLQGNRTKKSGMIVGLARQLALQMQQQRLNTESEQGQALAEERRQKAAAFNWTPDEATRTAARWTNNELIKVGPDRWALAPYGDNTGPAGEPKVLPFKDPISGETVPGLGIVQGPGKQFQVVPYGTGEPAIGYDESTGSLYKVGKNGIKTPLNLQEIQALRMGDLLRKSGSLPSGLPQTSSPQSPAPAASATPNPPGGGQSTIDQILSFIGNLRPGAQSSIRGDATANPTPVGPSATPNPQDLANQIKQQFRTGAISREDAINKLQTLGFK